ncbi:MAG: hypothetical protein AAGA61_05490, partial [Pseudomonadota bacterium]
VMSFVAMIDDADTRKRTRMNHVYQLARVDRQAALALFEEMELSDEERSRYRRYIDNMTGIASLH